MSFMSNILSKTGLGALAVGASVALAPMTASAATVTSSGITGGCENSIVDQALGFIDVAGGGGSWNSTFSDGSPAGQCLFNLTNTTGTVNAITVAVATINQGGSWGFGDSSGAYEPYFDNGAGFSAGSLLDGSDILWQVAAGVAGTQTFSFNLAPGETQFFDPFWGDVYATGNTNPFINFSVDATPIPLPAGGLLLLTALGGVAALRRKRKAA